MILFILLFTLIAFSIYFYLIDFQILSFFPVILFLIYLARNLRSVSWTQIQKKYLSESILLTISWILILIGIYTLLSLFNIPLLQKSLYLVGINIVFWLTSYVLKYTDGDIIFPTGYYLSFLFFIIVGLINKQISLIDSVQIFCAITFALLGFISFIIGIKYRVKIFYKYKLLIVGMLLLFISLYKFIANFYIFLLIVGLILAILFYTIKQFLDPKSLQHESKDISVRKILAGERILPYLKKKDMTNQSTNTSLSIFINNMPVRTKYILELFNISILVLLIVHYLNSAMILGDSANKISYRLIIIVFLNNVFILKKIGYKSLIQKISIFLGVNTIIYLALLSMFDGSWGEVALFVIIRNLLSAILFIYAQNFSWARLIQRGDYIIRFIMDIIFFIINIIILSLINIPIQFLLSIIFIYVGLRTILGLYQIKKLKDISV